MYSDCLRFAEKNYISELHLMANDSVYSSTIHAYKQPVFN